MINEINIYEIIIKRAYSREIPYLENKIKEKIHHYVLHNEPIKLVWFRGVGNKIKPNWADIETCKHLSKLNKEVQSIYPLGIEFTFVFATNHWIHNGISTENISSYFDEMEKIMYEFNFRSIYLESLRKKYEITFKKIDELFEEKKGNWWNIIENHELIEHSAQERNFRLKPQIAAQKYYIMRNIEKEMLEKEFTDYIFHTFSDSRFRNVLPDLPTLYFFSIKKRRSDAPWFVTEDKQ